MQRSPVAPLQQHAQQPLPAPARPLPPPLPSLRAPQRASPAPLPPAVPPQAALRGTWRPRQPWPMLWHARTSSTRACARTWSASLAPMRRRTAPWTCATRRASWRRGAGWATRRAQRRWQPCCAPQVRPSISRVHLCALMARARRAGHVWACVCVQGTDACKPPGCCTCKSLQTYASSWVSAASFRRVNHIHHQALWLKAAVPQVRT